MKQIPVSKFKANCSGFIKQVQKTSRSVQITPSREGDRGDQTCAFGETCKLIRKNERNG